MGVSFEEAPMFARIKKSGAYQYLQIVENNKVRGKVNQRVIATVGRLDQLQAKNQVETLIRSLSRYSEKVLLVLSGKSDLSASAKKIGPALIFEGLWMHHVYRAMSFLGEEIEDQRGATPFALRRTKDLIEEGMFFERRDLFTGLDLVFFDTTSIYFEGDGGEGLGEKGHRKGDRPDLNQMVVGVVLDNGGKPVCCEMWPWNTTDVKSLI